MAPVRDQQRIDRTQVLLSALSCDVWYCPRAIPEIVHVAHALKSEYFQIFNELVVPLGAEELALSAQGELLGAQRQLALSGLRERVVSSVGCTTSKRSVARARGRTKLQVRARGHPAASAAAAASAASSAPFGTRAMPASAVTP